MKSEGRCIIHITKCGQRIEIEVYIVDSVLPVILAQKDMERLGITLHSDSDEIEIPRTTYKQSYVDPERDQRTDESSCTEKNGEGRGM